MTERPFLSVIFPAWNEQDQLPDTLQTAVDYFRKQEYSTEIIVVDDGSTDRTVSVTQSFIVEHQPPPEIRLIENDHRGKGYTVRTGMLEGKGRYVLFIDADLATPIHEVGKVIGALEAGYDIAIGTRQGIGAQRVNEPLLRHLLGRLFNLIVKLLSGLRFEDTQAGFKGFRREVAQDIFQRVQLHGANAKPARGRTITAFDVEVLYLAQLSGYRIEEIPVKWECGRHTKLRSPAESMRMLIDVIRIRRIASQGMYER
jgi:glycosyltransferase involved in cell wall biosynthesis